MTTTAQTHCIACAAPRKPGKELCSYCDTPYVKVEDKPVRKELESKMSTYPRLENVILRGNMNTIVEAVDCTIIGKMNRVQHAVRCTVVGKMNTLQVAEDCTVKGKMNTIITVVM